jgi:solute carrier family 25 phosphate transporter 23/24/25/41
MGCKELWHIFHDELDLDGNGMLDEKELTGSLSKCGTQILSFYITQETASYASLGIELDPLTLHEFMHSVSLNRDSRQINFADFRDFFILLPRKISPAEIYQYYELRKYLGDDGRGPARVTMEGNDFQIIAFCQIANAFALKAMSV